MAERCEDPREAADAAVTLEAAEAALQELEASLSKLEEAAAEEKRRRAHYEGLLRAKRGSVTAATYADLLAVTRSVVQRVEESGRGFVSQRGARGYHILFDGSEMSSYFEEIREGMRPGGKKPSPAISQRGVGPTSSNRDIWEALVSSLEFSGVDFEHMYKIVPAGADAAEQVGALNYSFPESIVLSHTLLLVPVLQHYAPLMPKLDLKGPTKKLDRAQPLLAVGMIGDCVKGSFFQEIRTRAEQGDEVAVKQRDTLLDPRRLQQKLRGLVQALVEACRRQQPQQVPAQQRRLRLHLDAVLVGTGAFGGDPKVLAQPFVDCLGGGCLTSAGGDAVNYFMFPPPAPEHLSLGQVGYSATLNPKAGLGAALPPVSRGEGAPPGGGGGGGSTVVRVLVAGFDPVSIAPHGVVYRAFSAEGQLCHTTDILERLSGVRGELVPVRVPKGLAWESPAAFFAKPQVLKTKDEEGYDTVRFVPRSVLEELGFEEGQELQIKERGAARVWNGDSFEGWTLHLADGTRGKSWQDVLGS